MSDVAQPPVGALFLDPRVPAAQRVKGRHHAYPGHIDYRQRQAGPRRHLRCEKNPADKVELIGDVLVPGQV